MRSRRYGTREPLVGVNISESEGILAGTCYRPPENSQFLEIFNWTWKERQETIKKRWWLVILITFFKYQRKE